MRGQAINVNRFFANCRLGFANCRHALRRATLALTAAAVAGLSGAFGTAAIEPLPRSAFWFGSIMSIWLAWEVWFGWWLRRGWSWQRALLSGFPLMLMLLPFQIHGLLRLLGHSPAPLPLLFVRGAIIGLVLLPVLLVFVPRPVTARGDRADTERTFPGTAILIDQIAALVAEDHYVRLHLADGTNRLLHRRFRDTVRDLAGQPGQQVHRGAWIAAAHRGRARRDGARWTIALPCGPTISVSRSRASELRKLGWIGRGIN
ncbi:MAG: LytTR family transcriptional regulator DNA-binding domain-containing protein [Novosphingobium sp.]|uniref:LytTR family transcriptional regulator DNA-binding domain-containing protein n=1 Tax=Novosphingobium sp. TaxID=1874826 RepID=UPI003919B2FB